MRAFPLSRQITSPGVSFSRLSRFEVVSRFFLIDCGDRQSGFPRARFSVSDRTKFLTVGDVVAYNN